MLMAVAVVYTNAAHSDPTVAQAPLGLNIGDICHFSVWYGFDCLQAGRNVRCFYENLAGLDLKVPMKKRYAESLDGAMPLKYLCEFVE